MSGPHHNYIRLLELGPFERRARGDWRFGTKTIRNHIVDRLIASGRAEIRGGRVYPVITEELVE